MIVIITGIHVKKKPVIMKTIMSPNTMDPGLAYPCHYAIAAYNVHLYGWGGDGHRLSRKMLD